MSEVSRSAAGLLDEQAAIVLGHDIFARSKILDRLFRFLLDCARNGRAPKEVEIAREVFGKEVEDDASIRVHIHRLRRKLDEFYVGAGANLTVRLTIPKGGYRLVAAAVDHAVPNQLGGPRAKRPRPLVAIAIGLLFVVTMLVTWWLARRPDAADDAIVTVRTDSLWQPVVEGDRRVAIVVGDYYIFGERDANGDMARLVREFGVNSYRDLEQRVNADPRHAREYVDLNLNYLPVGTGNAIRLVAPIVRRNSRGEVANMVVPVSRLTPEQVKLNNIVYLGYLSGLASLRDAMFGASRYAIGSSYDEIVDQRTGTHFTGGSHLEAADDMPTRDYALIASFGGASGNRIVIIGGTRDAALMQATEFATRPDTLAQLTRAVGGARDFEALLAIDSLRGVGMRARIVSAGSRRERDWSGRPEVFPDTVGSEAPQMRHSERK